ncbi:FecR family protein [Sphingobacterium puteale]|uniref:FecR family protein n=1 Tax=Sphingobacterium puteale TaxID=2420510 RepID=UPI003D9828C4
MKQDKKQDNIRKKIWKMPFLINGLFKDEDWAQFDGAKSDKQIPGDKMLSFIQKEILAAEQRKERKIIRKHRVVRMLRYTAAAAVLVFFSFHFISQWTKEEPALSNKGGAVAQQPAADKDTSWTLIENKNPQSMLLDLPDGSRVRLFSRSHIRYTKEFTGKSRDIQLVGKAYFDVASDPGRPFSVFAAGTKTTALGTSFTINTSMQNKAVTVALHTGKVLISSVSNRFREVFLNSPGQRLSVNRRGLTTVEIPRKKRIAKEPDLSAPELLNLKNTPMPIVLQGLENAFGHKIHIADHVISEIHYTGEIDIHKEKLKDILTTICLINELRYVTNPDGSYTLYKQEKTKTENLNN